MQMVSARIKDCPFCNGEAYLQADHNHVFVVCVSCNAKGPAFAFEEFPENAKWNEKIAEIAIDIWNSVYRVS